MAENIQSKVYLIHKVEENKPTKPSSPTLPKETPNGTPKGKKESPESANDDVDKKVRDGIERVAGSVSVARRVMNTTMKQVSATANIIYDNLAFKEQFIGNTRGAVRLQNDKQMINAAVQFGTSALGAGITAVALGNPAIVGVYLGSVILETINQFANRTQQIEQFNIERAREIYESQYARERLAMNTYNRRRV